VDFDEIDDFLSRLREEKQLLDEAIASLEKISASQGKGRRKGRPPNWLKRVEKTQSMLLAHDPGESSLPH
jgi:hypothetical protein